AGVGAVRREEYSRWRTILRRHEVERGRPQAAHGGALVHRRQGRSHPGDDLCRLSPAHASARRGARPCRREILVREILRAALMRSSFIFACLVTASLAAHAQYPSRPVLLVVPYSAGSDADL